MTVWASGKRERGLVAGIGRWFWLYSTHEDERIWLWHYRLDPRRAVETSWRGGRSAVADPKFRRDTSSDGGIFSRIFGRSLVRKGACDSLPERSEERRVGKECRS